MAKIKAPFAGNVQGKYECRCYARSPVHVGHIRPSVDAKQKWLAHAQ